MRSRGARLIEDVSQREVVDVLKQDADYLERSGLIDYSLILFFSVVKSETKSGKYTIIGRVAICDITKYRVEYDKKTRANKYLHLDMSNWVTAHQYGKRFVENMADYFLGQDQLVVYMKSLKFSLKIRILGMISSRIVRNSNIKITNLII